MVEVSALSQSNPHSGGTHRVATTIPMKAAPNVLLRSKSIAIVGRKEGGAEGRGDRKTLNLFLLSQFMFINVALRTLTRAIVQRRKAAVETKVSGIKDDEQRLARPGTFFSNSGTQLIVQPRVSPGFGMASARVRAVHGKGYSNDGGDPYPASRMVGRTRVSESDLTLHFTPSRSTAPDSTPTR